MSRIPSWCGCLFIDFFQPSALRSLGKENAAPSLLQYANESYILISGGAARGGDSIVGRRWGRIDSKANGGSGVPIKRQGESKTVLSSSNLVIDFIIDNQILSHSHLSIFRSSAAMTKDHSKAWRWRKEQSSLSWTNWPPPCRYDWMEGTDFPSFCYLWFKGIICLSPFPLRIMIAASRRCQHHLSFHFISFHSF